MSKDIGEPAPLADLIEALNAGDTIIGGIDLYLAMYGDSQEAIRIASELNGSYHDQAEVRALLSELIGRQVDDSVGLFPPFYSDFGKNIRLGRDVFINMGCKFQDQGGITIGDGSLIGHNVLIATLNHDMDPDKRADMKPAPVTIGEKVWVGANATILPGVTVGDGAVIAAASVVTRDVPANALAVGSPAKVVRDVVPSD